ncbi:hypothetical protein GCK32_012424 [Trichostrongylus colubriformis]|uniref:Uncharacterized protein n=1 Tax=Trichostrongylus colubriformis TaxID=6319 RepID=A0AAN8F3U9_TRICO
MPSFSECYQYRGIVVKCDLKMCRSNFPGKIDTVLWGITFALTVWFFRLPVSIWFSKKVNWALATLSVICFSIFCSCGLWLLWKYRSISRWRVLNPYFFALAWIAFAAGVVSFSASTWTLFGWWSLYIAGVTIMFLISIASIFA